MTEQTSHDLEQRFAELSKSDQQVLRAMAVVCEPLNRTNLVPVLCGAGAENGRGRAFSTTELLRCLTRLKDLGLVAASEDGAAYRVPTTVAHALIEGMGQKALRSLVRGVREARPLQSSRYTWSIEPGTLARELFLSLYVEADPSLQQTLARVTAYSHDTSEGRLWQVALGSDPPRAVLTRLPQSGWNAYLAGLLDLGLADLTPCGGDALGLAIERAAELDAAAAASLCVVLALRGEAEVALQVLAREGADGAAARAFAQASLGRYEAAREEAQRALTLTIAKSSGKLKGLKGPWSRWVNVLLLTGDSPKGHDLARAQLATKWAASSDRMLSLLTHALDDHRNGAVTADYQAAQELSMVEGYFAPQGWNDLLAWSGLRRLLQRELTKPEIHLLNAYSRRAKAGGYGWLGRELGQLASGQPAAFTRLMRARPTWERVVSGLEAALDELANTGPGAGPSTKTASERLVWTVVEAEGSHQLAARIQGKTANGFRVGRQASWKTLKETPNAPFLTDDDRRVLGTVTFEAGSSYYGTGGQYVVGSEALLALVGHPLVFADHECKQALTIVRGTPRVEVQEQGPELSVTLVPEGLTPDGVLCVREAPDRLVVYRLSGAQATLSRLLDKRLTLPAEVRERSRALLGRLVAHFPVASDVELAGAAGGFEACEGDPRPCIDLTPLSAGLSARVQVLPAGEGQAFSPGEGPASVFARVERAGKQVSLRCQRDLPRERECFARLMEACPQLDGVEGASSIQVPTRLECLELLLALGALGDAVRVRWPEGQPVTVLGERGLTSMQVRVASQAEWLSAEGDLTVDAETKLTLRELLERFGRRAGRFIELENGQFIALAKDLERKLEALAATSEARGDKLVVHPLVADVLFAPEEFEGVTADKAVKKRLARLAEAQHAAPELPKGFEADLRSYQREGFVWLTRLSMWGAGACLADDMGLGKTLQTLAHLLAHAPRGPSLVVAPMSVCDNWRSEARRFAPALNLRMLAGEDRKAVIDAAAPFDVIVVSYGILQQEIERLEQVRFQVVVLDEAQAIKNAQTLRARAAFRLQGAHRVALTGTPVENHLGELWSIFAFLNPGLLGSAKAFEARFAKPMQRDGDERASRSLRRLLKPFVLRRRKADVLEDLPPKTEITLRVEPSPEELALYEALREQALSRLAQSTKDAKQRIRVLAEVMKLRRAACNPALVAPELGLSSQKLETFEALVAELEQGGHRALVFSQFVDHLALVRARLDTLGLPYQYLDGSSTRAQRAAAVSAFQQGEGKLFLISLKAGGFGLNLTAADYVIHLDPWWNPAVEDQASDRAHRIGQNRPVTVYRLVMRGSIEEKILRLHHDKRELSDSLLDGTSQGAALSVDDLMDLLQDERAPASRASRPGRVARTATLG